MEVSHSGELIGVCSSTNPGVVYKVADCVVEINCFISLADARFTKKRARLDFSMNNDAIVFATRQHRAGCNGRAHHL